MRLARAPLTRAHQKTTPGARCSETIPKMLTVRAQRAISRGAAFAAGRIKEEV